MTNEFLDVKLFVNYVSCF